MNKKSAGTESELRIHTGKAAVGRYIPGCSVGIKQREVKPKTEMGVPWMAPEENTQIGIGDGVRSPAHFHVLIWDLIAISAMTSSYPLTILFVHPFSY